MSIPRPLSHTTDALSAGPAASTAGHASSAAIAPIVALAATHEAVRAAAPVTAPAQVVPAAVTGSAIPFPTMAVVDMVWPDQSNHHGTLFGGAALSILDRMAFIVGSKVLRGTVVTGSVASLNFLAPAPAGHVVECQVSVLRRGNRSVKLDTRLIAEDLLTGTHTVCLIGEFVMVRQAGTEPQAIAPPASPRPPAALPMEASAGDHQPPASAAALPQRVAADSTLTYASAMVAEIVFPGHANHRSMLHGGPAMEWMAKAGFVAATRQVRRPVVMASSAKLDFKAPAYVGDVVEVTATVVRMGTRSIHVHADMWAESPVTGERRHCTAGRFVFVALKGDSDPVSVSEVH